MTYTIVQLRKFSLYTVATNLFEATDFIIFEEPP